MVYCCVELKPEDRCQWTRAQYRPVDVVVVTHHLFIKLIVGRCEVESNDECEVDDSDGSA
jgi:hypothetical protein